MVSKVPKRMNKQKEITDSKRKTDFCFAFNYFYHYLYNCNPSLFFLSFFSVSSLLMIFESSHLFKTTLNYVFNVYYSITVLKIMYDGLKQNKNRVYFCTPADERTSVLHRTPTECTPTTATDTTSTCRRPCLPTPGSPSREPHGRYPALQFPAPHTPPPLCGCESCMMVTHLFFFFFFVFLLAFINRELGIETVAPYPPSGHLHSHLHHYHPAPRLHHFPIPFMVSTTGIH